MSPRLVLPAEVGEHLAKRLRRSWPDLVVAQALGLPNGTASFQLRPGVTSSAGVERLGFEAWADWIQAWAQVDLDDLAPAVALETRPLTVQGVRTQRPWRLRVGGLDASITATRRLGTRFDDSNLDRSRLLAATLLDAGARLTAPALAAVCRLSDVDAQNMSAVVAWLARHPDLSHWTLRQLPVPGMHSKWLTSHQGLLMELTGRNPMLECRPRLSVVHLTYVDPAYRKSGRRHHDAWTSGDRHVLPYRPRTVLVVENRDCRLWFPPVPDTVVVEGGGKAAVSLLSEIDWMVEAERLVYWGDIDADGMAILNALRARMHGRGVHVQSILMDDTALMRYAHLGVAHDQFGEPIAPSSTHLPNLTEQEAACYAAIATAGQVPFRRIEQERIDLSDAVAALNALD